MKIVARSTVIVIFVMKCDFLMKLYKKEIIFFCSDVVFIAIVTETHCGNLNLLCAYLYLHIVDKFIEKFIHIHV